MLSMRIVISSVFLSVLSWAILLIAAGKRLKSPAIQGLCASGLIYSVGYALELMSADLPALLTVIRAEYVGIALIPAFLIMIAQDFSNPDRRLVPVPTLFVVPVIVLVLVFTMGSHKLYYIDPHMTRVAGLSIIRFTRGPAYWLQVVYVNLAFLYGIFVAASNSITGPKAKRFQARYLLVGCVIPQICNLLYLVDVMPWGLDPFPILMPVTGAFFVLGFSRYRIFDARPVARDQVFEQMRDAVLVTDDRGRIVDHNDAAALLFPALRHNREIRDIAPSLPSPSEEAQGSRKEVGVTLSLPEGERRFDLRRSRISNRKGRTVGMTYIFMDATERFCREERLTDLASKDELTGVANRRHFFKLARAEQERAERYGRPFGVAILDLDDFKGINDNHGHFAGDEAIRQVSRICSTALRSEDIMGRYGGDEFAFAFPECDEMGALQAAERLERLISSASFQYGGKSIRLSASAGAAGVSSPPLPQLEDLLKLADERMYVRKGTRSGGAPEETER